MTSLQLINVNLKQSKNAAAHHTSDYDTSHLVARRGQSVEIDVTFDKAVESGDSLSITVETGPSASESKNTKAVMPVSSSGSTTSWNAVRGATSGNTMTININVPVNAVIGLYSVNLQVTSGGRTSSSNIGNLCVLFNPWKADDEVYMASNEDRTEYVLNETGLYWFGSSSNYGSRRWDYGPFEEGILDITLKLMDSSPDYRSDPATDVSRRNDPIHVGRVLSSMVNSNDDNGAIVGNWSGNYEGGENPTSWNSSVSILRKWNESGPVRYGQCWVYAGVLCTVLRCLGIPARLIVNFDSAHDTDENLVVDNYYDPSGRKIDSMTNDSVWNFHAWTEGFFKRNDLGSAYDGWQILDATPQEQSDGSYRLGPTSLNAVKEGDVDLNYDTPFTYAEVNSDTYDWIVYSNGTTRVSRSSPHDVGRLISTKGNGSFTRSDVTSNYKYAEGSPKEREIFNKARGKLLVRNGVSPNTLREIAPAVKPGFSGTFKMKGEPQVGEDFAVNLILKNTAPDTQTLKVNFTATTIIYNSKPVKDILSETQSVTLGPNEEKTVTVTITYNQYVNEITTDNMIQVVAVCEEAKGGKLLAEIVITLRNPQLLIKVKNPAKLNAPVKVDMIFTNPLKENVANSTLTIEGSGLVKKPIVINVPSMKPNETMTIPVEISPYRVGDKSLMADFSSKQFTNVKAYESVEVASS